MHESRGSRNFPARSMYKGRPPSPSLLRPAFGGARGPRRLECTPTPLGLWELGSGRIRYLNPATANLEGFLDCAEASARTAAEFFTGSAVNRPALVWA
ncbi:hypothetical protein [Rhodococcus wratislaviensis]|uniref:hypothetical protein n=1 Tax=Rhodococcus wratislaviensis TaxID=44752 RepID=UPI0036514CBC